MTLIDKSTIETFANFADVEKQENVRRRNRFPF